jgi:hypothetical protein
LALTERLAVIIDARTDGAVRGFNRLGDAATQTSRRIDDRLANGLNRSLERVGVQTRLTGAAIQAAGVAAGGAIAAGLAVFATAGVQNFVNLADKVRDFQRASGASAEESSAFVAVLDDLGISAETGSAAIAKLGRTINTQKFTDLGIDIAVNAEGATDLTETLLNVADAYAATPDPAKRAELAFAAFGRQGQQLIPLLEQGRRGLERFFAGVDNQILSQEDLDTAREYEIAMDNLGDSVGALQREFGSRAVPAVASFTAALSEMIDEGIPRAANVAGDLFGKFVDSIPGAQVGLGAAASVFGDLGNAISLIAEDNIAAADAARRHEDALRNAAEAAAQFDAEIEDTIKTLFRRADVEDSLVETTERIAALQREIDEAPARHRRELADAEESLSDARRRQVDATETLADAQQRLNELRNEDPAAELAAAAADAASAVARISQAQARVRDAQSQLQRARDTGQAPNRIAELEADLQAATADVAQAQVTAAEAQDKLNRARSGQDRLREIREAEDRVADAQRNVGDAADGVADAQARLNEVREQDPSGRVIELNRQLNAEVRREAELRGELAEQSGGLQAKLDAEIGVFDRYRGHVGGLNDEYEELLRLRDQVATGALPVPPPSGAEGLQATIGAVVAGQGVQPQAGAGGLTATFGAVVGTAPPPPTSTVPAPAPSSVTEINFNGPVATVSDTQLAQEIARREKLAEINRI